MSKPKKYTEEELKQRKNLAAKLKRQNESIEDKIKRYEVQKKWNNANLDKIQGYREKFKEDRKIVASEWQKANKQKAKENHKKWGDENREWYNLRAKIYKDNNKNAVLKSRRENVKIRKLKDPIFKFSENIRALVAMSFKRGELEFKKKNRTEQILGCKMSFFINYILDKCPEGVTLKDFGRYGYQLDHIIPISSALTESDVLKLNHYTNFQPLFWRDNILKSNKLLKHELQHNKYSFLLQCSVFTTKL